MGAVDRVEIINNDTYHNMKKYCKYVIEHIKKEYDKNCLKPQYYTDILHLAAVCYRENEDKEKWDEIGYNMCKAIKKVVENYSIYKYNCAMVGGFGYMCYAVALYSKNTGRLKKFSSDLHRIFMKETRNKAIELQKGYNTNSMEDYDCIVGISGSLNYLLDYNANDGDLYKDTIRESIKYLIGLTETHEYKGRKIYNFHVSSEKQFHKEESQMFPNGNFNFGLAHGIIGPLIALSKAYKQGYRISGIENAIKDIFNFYCHFKVKREDVLYWPGQLSYEEYIAEKVNEHSIHYASSWCYGNIGIMRGLFITAQNMGWIKESVFYAEELTKALNRSMEEFYVISPALCHGYTSVLAIRTSMFGINDEKSIINRIDDNIEKIISLSEKNTKEIKKDISLAENEDGRLEGYLGEYSLLSGVTGILLSFWEILYGDNDYKKILMMI